MITEFKVGSYYIVDNDYACSLNEDFYIMRNNKPTKCIKAFKEKSGVSFALFEGQEERHCHGRIQGCYPWYSEEFIHIKEVSGYVQEEIDV